MNSMKSMLSRRDSPEEAAMDYDLRHFLELQNAGSHHHSVDSGRPRTMPGWNSSRAYHMEAEDSDSDGSHMYGYRRSTAGRMSGHRSRLPRAAPPAPFKKLEVLRHLLPTSYIPAFPENALHEQPFHNVFNMERSKFFAQEASERDFNRLGMSEEEVRRMPSIEDLDEEMRAEIGRLQGERYKLFHEYQNLTTSLSEYKVELQAQMSARSTILSETPLAKYLRQQFTDTSLSDRANEIVSLENIVALDEYCKELKWELDLPEGESIVLRRSTVLGMLAHLVDLGVKQIEPLQDRLERKKKEKAEQKKVEVKLEGQVKALQGVLGKVTSDNLDLRRQLDFLIEERKATRMEKETVKEDSGKATSLAAQLLTATGTDTQVKASSKSWLGPFNKGKKRNSNSSSDQMEVDDLGDISDGSTVKSCASADILQAAVGRVISPI